MVSDRLPGRTRLTRPGPGNEPSWRPVDADSPKVLEPGRGLAVRRSEAATHLQTFDSILGAAQAGGEWAWRVLYDEYFPPLVGYFRVQGSRDPEDLAGDVLLRMSRTIHNFTGTEGKFRSWVFTIAHNRLIDERRRRTRKPENLESEPPELPAPAQTDTAALNRLGTEAVVEALDLLSSDQREVLALRILNGFTIAEIAGVTGKGVGAVKQLQRRALRRLAKHFGNTPYPLDHSERSR